MNHKSGLADSPFFQLVSPPEQPYKVNEGTTAPMNTGAVVQVVKATEAQAHIYTNEQMPMGASVQDYRTTKRQSYDVYVDQIDQIDERIIQRRRELGKQVTG